MTRAVYVVFSHTNTNFGRLIRTVTRGEYNHVSVSLRRDLALSYSFARYAKNAPLWGGFVTETPARFLDSGDIKIKVARLEVSERDYAVLAKRLEDCSRRSAELLYNHFGAAAALFHRRLRIRGCYICFEFVSEILGYDVRTIRQFERALSESVVYEGSFSGYTALRCGADSEYFSRRRPAFGAMDTVRELASEASRAVHP